MAPQAPLLLVDNKFDTISLYPLATLSVSSELTGREGFRVADGRRERSWWQGATSATGHFIAVDLGVGNTGNVDSVYFDRGHNLATRQVEIDYSDNGSAWTALVTLTFPAATVVGGDPTLTTLSQTEEGANYALFAAAAGAHRYWRILMLGTAFIPVVPGVILGMRTQLLSPWGWSNVKDEDAMNRTEIQEMSRSGYLGTDKRYAWRTIVIGLDKIGATDYDATIRTLRRQLFELDQPFVAVMDYGTRPERAWLYRWDGTQYSSAANRTLRSVQLRGREVGPLLR
jgi:hypothetical protein